MRVILAEEGFNGIWKGALPTLIGYSIQGLFKFGLYEYFKDYYSTMAGEENSVKYRGLIWLAGSASAEFIADIGLCPMEMVKVKIQTSPAGTWPIAFLPALRKMQEMKADTRFPFGSVVPLWSRQIPYTMAKFFFFEKVSLTSRLCKVELHAYRCFVSSSRLFPSSILTFLPNPRAAIQRQHSSE